MKKNIIFLLVVLFIANAFTLQTPDIKISLENSRIEGNFFQCKISFFLPEGWKLPKKPSISALKAKNISNFTYSPNEHLEKVNDTTYRIHFYASVDNMNIADNNIDVRIECPVCRDNVCTIVSQDISVHFEYDMHEFSLIFMIMLATLGGFILNFMPCVLPVILMKLRSFTETNRRIAIIGSIAGNYTSFIALLIFFAILKLGGEIVGWGMHFQNVNFLKFAVASLYIFTLFSFEIIEFSASIRMANKTRTVFLNNFVSSIVASIIAIPCTAPFLGTAATFALQGTLPQMTIIFLSIATGFSIPYMIAFLVPFEMFPQKIGKFSLIVKKIVNLGVFTAFLWMVFLLSNHVNTNVIACYLGTFALCAVLFKKKYNLAAIFIFATVFLTADNKAFFEQKESKSANTKTNQETIWENHYDIGDVLNIIAKCVASNRVAILNISADWCLTCKYNKINVLDNNHVVQIIKNKNILCLECDMTQKNDMMMRFIGSHGRVGIPFTMVYGPNAKGGILLSEIISANELMEAIKKAECGINK